MTVCIAAICDSGESIAIAADRMISMGYVSSDSVTSKAVKVHGSWICMFAGNDIGRVEPIIMRVAGNLQHPSAPEHPTIAEVENIAVKSFQEESRNEATNLVLSPYNIDLETFKSKGRDIFGEGGFDEVRRRYEAVRLECRFLVAGFGKERKACLFEVGSPGVSRRLTPVGFWAIGSGAQSAISSLMYRGYHVGVPHHRAAYYACEAKFVAEAAVGVGDATTMGIFRNDGSTGYLTVGETDNVRQRWNKQGRPRLPKGVDQFIAGAITWIAEGSKNTPDKKPE